jgi:hypothetical protein
MGKHLGLCAFLAVTQAACPTVNLGPAPIDIGECNPMGGVDYFNNQIWPNYIVSNGSRSCIDTSAGCHAENGGNIMSFNTADPMDIANYKAAQEQLNCATPEASPFLTRPLASEDPHGGGDLFTSNTAPPVEVFLAWFM